MSAMEGIKQKLASLRLEVERAHDKAEVLEKKVKELEQQNLQKDQEITSQAHRIMVQEAEIEKLEKALAASKNEAEAGAQHGTQNEALQRRLQLLEEEAEEADKNLRETNDKLRQTDVKAGHFERKVQALEVEKDRWETKYEEMAKKFAGVQKELDEFQQEIGNI